MNTNNNDQTSIPHVWATLPIQDSVYDQCPSQRMLRQLVTMGIDCNKQGIPRVVALFKQETITVTDEQDAMDQLKALIHNEMKHSSNQFWEDEVSRYRDALSSDNDNCVKGLIEKAFDSLAYANDEWKAKLLRALHVNDLILGNHWPQVKEYLNQSICPRSKCDKCTLCLVGDGTDDPETICKAYVTDRCGSRDPGRSRACCLWEHSVSITQIAAVLKDEFAISDQVGRKHARRYMDDCLSAFPLGTPTNDKHSYKVTLYCEVSDQYKAVDRHGNLSGAASHYYVYMGYCFVF
jgi:hypothetical protein